MRRPLAAVLVVGAALLVPGALRAADPQVLCDGRPGCQVNATPAGLGKNGKPVGVIELTFEQPPQGAWAEGIECRDGWRELYVDAGDETTELLELCNDGYGAAGIGEDEIEIGDNSLTHSQVGGSAWRWGRTDVYQLQPLRELREAWDGYWSLGLNYETGSWDWTNWSQGDVEWWSPACRSDGEIPEPGPNDPPDEEINRAVLIPRLEATALPAGSYDVSPGTCATTLSAETGRGFVVWGDAAAAAADAAWMKLLTVEPDLLYVAVRTQRIAAGGKSWLSDDHIEIWQSPTVSYYEACLTGEAKAEQWAVRLIDSAVFAAEGTPREMPQVLARSSTVDSGGGVIVSMTLKLAQPLENLSVVFSKGDGASRQLWLLASSALRFGQAASLGTTFAVPATAATCVVDEGRINVKRWGRAIEGPE